MIRTLGGLHRRLWDNIVERVEENVRNGADCAYTTMTKTLALNDMLDADEIDFRTGVALRQHHCCALCLAYWYCREKRVAEGRQEEGRDSKCAMCPLGEEKTRYVGGRYICGMYDRLLRSDSPCDQLRLAVEIRDIELDSGVFGSEEFFKEAMVYIGGSDERIQSI